MSYAVEWMGGVAAYWIAFMLLIVPWFAAVAVVVATIAVLVVALAALVGLVALVAVGLASLYRLVRTVRRRRARRRTRSVDSPKAIASLSAAGSPAGLDRAHVTVLAHAEPAEAAAIFEDAA
jgi:hypothetical protein